MRERGFLGQSGDLILAGFAALLSLCIYAAGLLDGLDTPFIRVTSGNLGWALQFRSTWRIVLDHPVERRRNVTASAPKKPPQTAVVLRGPAGAIPAAT
jgi:hypothetical protein